MDLATISVILVIVGNSLKVIKTILKFKKELEDAGENNECPECDKHSISVLSKLVSDLTKENQRLYQQNQELRNK